MTTLSPTEVTQVEDPLDVAVITDTIQSIRLRLHPPEGETPTTLLDRCVSCADVLRMTRPLGLAVLDRLRRARVPLGPVADTVPRATVEFVVPAGASGSWPVLPPWTTCVSACRTRWPVPGRTGRVAGRRWLVAPWACAAPYTDPDILCEAVGAEMLRHAAVPVPAGRVCS
jgi:hypothetical protein